MLGSHAVAAIKTKSGQASPLECSNAFAASISRKELKTRDIDNPASQQYDLPNKCDSDHLNNLYYRLPSNMPDRRNNRNLYRH